MNDNWYLVTNANEIDSPALLVYPERIKANIQTAISMAGGTDRLRPHVKTHKCAEVARLMMDAGISKFKCATIAEAEMLAMLQAKDVLLAYQPTGPKLQRFIALIKKYPQTEFSCLVDNQTSADEQASAFRDAGLAVPVYIDLDSGMHRTGVAPGDEALDLYKYCSAAPGFRIRGLHAYDGHIRDIDPQQKKKNCDAAFEPVWTLAQKIENLGLGRPVIIAGGTPSFSVHCKREGVECSPGTFIYWDQGYTVLCPEQEFRCAAILLTRVVSLPGGMVCTDLGHKSVAAENELAKRVYFPDAPMLKPISHSEEHLVLQHDTVNSFVPGDILYGIPYHICPTVALYDRVKVIEAGNVVGEWKNIARDRKLSV